MSRSAAGRIGGHMRAATAPSRQAITQAATDGRWQRYLDQARAMAPDGASDEDISRRAESLQRAAMTRLSAAGVAARKKRAAERSALQITGGETDEH